jgi:hypothetical protein
VYHFPLFHFFHVRLMLWNRFMYHLSQINHLYKHEEYGDSIKIHVSDSLCIVS